MVSLLSCFIISNLHVKHLRHVLFTSPKVGTIANLLVEKASTTGKTVEELKPEAYAIVKEAFGKVLGIDDVHDETDFFEAGGGESFI